MTQFIVTFVSNAQDTSPRPIPLTKIVEVIRTGGTKLKGQITQIRNRFEAELALTGNYKAAKELVSPLKKQLPAVLFSASKIAYRENKALEEHSGLFCADMDHLSEKEIATTWACLTDSPHVVVMFCSPCGDGLKVVFRVVPEIDRHRDSFRAIRQYVLQLTGKEIDEKCKDEARMNFLSFDPRIYVNLNAVVIGPLPLPAKPPRIEAKSEVPADLPLRERIATELLGPLTWSQEKGGYFCKCPGEASHTNSTGFKHTILYLDGVPTLDCQHDSCSGIVAAFNAQLRSLIGKAEHSAGSQPKVGAHGEEPAEKKKDGRESDATALVKIARGVEGFGLFHDPQDRPFVRLENKGHTEIWPVESTRFRRLLGGIFYKEKKRSFNRNALGDAITTLAGLACFEGEEGKVHLRVAWHEGNILIDLCDAAWRVIKVTPSGWEILDESPVAFVRTGSMQPLPEPVQGAGSIEELWKLLNISEAQRPLVAGALLNAFHPDGPYLVTNYVGEQATAKTSAARIHRMLVDPNENPLRSPPKEERDLLAQAANNWCVAFDNLSYLPSWLSDAICRLATGGGHSARTLYTDMEEISIAVKRPVILNGIEDVARRPDLADRALQIELEVIPRKKRIPEKNLWPLFESVRASIFGAILDGLCCALRELPAVERQFSAWPRMADAAMWATAGETAFGWKRGTFLAVYGQNLDESARAAVESNPVGVAIQALLDEQDQWEGEPRELLEALEGLVGEKVSKQKNWPQNVRSLGHCLRRLAPALRRAGIGFERASENKRRIIRLSTSCRHKGKETSKTSKTSFAQENDENGTSSPIVSKTATSSPTPLGRDDVDVPDDVFPTLHVSGSKPGNDDDDVPDDVFSPFHGHGSEPQKEPSPPASAPPIGGDVDEI
jgi:BT4734-like, N-terminal domain